MTKSKRLKTVFSSQQKVAELWLEQSQHEARTKHCSFVGPELSIDGEFAAKIVTYRGVRVALFLNGKSFRDGAFGSGGAYLHVIAKTTKTKIIHVDEIDSKFTCIEKWLLQNQSDILDGIIEKLSGESSYFCSGNVSEHNKECDLLGFKHLKIKLPKGLYNEVNKFYRFKQKAATDSWSRKVLSLFDSYEIERKLKIGRRQLNNFESRSVA